VNTGDTAVDVKLLGPLHAYDDEPVPVTPVAVNVSVPPKQIGFGDPLMLPIVGIGLTVTGNVVAVALTHPAPV